MEAGDDIIQEDSVPAGERLCPSRQGRLEDIKSPFLTLSNFYVREDRETENLLLHMSRLFANDFRKDGNVDWTSDALLYGIKIV